MRTFADESIHALAGIYVVGAAVVDPERVGDLEASARGLSSLAPPDLWYGFSRPVDEPLLWVADAVSSCVAAYVRDGSYGERLGGWPLETLAAI